MVKIQFLVLLGTTFCSINSYALSPDAAEGKKLYPACHVCHDQLTEPPLGPPMWGVQSRYNRNALDKEDFINNMTGFVKAPTLKTAIHDEAVEQLGLMPPMPLPDDILNKISTYIFEEKFPPPCEHWKLTAKSAIKEGDAAHASKVKRQLKRFCN